MEPITEVITSLCVDLRDGQGDLDASETESAASVVDRFDP